MTRIRAIILGTGIMLLGMLGLYACGGETPTATPVAPTATPVPPTATSVPATPTAMAVAPTATGASGSASTRGFIAAATATAARSTRSSFLGAKPADVQLINDALSKAEALTSFHYIMNASGDVFTQTVKAEGDFLAPDKGHLTVTVGNQTVEELIVGDKVYIKQNGQWVPKPETSTSNSMGIDPSNITSSANPLEGLRSFVEAADDYRDAGTEKINGVNTRHFTFNLSTEKVLQSSGSSDDEIAKMKEQMGGSLPSLGSGEVWIDASTKNVIKYAMSLDLGAFFQMLTAALSGLGGTPTVVEASPTPIPPIIINLDVTISKHNDPSITMPEAPAEEATETPVPEDTPEVSDTPVVSDTPEQVDTPDTGMGDATPTAGPTLKTGETGQADGLNVTLNKVRTETTGTLPPEAGSQYLILNLTFENTSQDEKTVSSLLEFQVTDNSGKDYSVSFTSGAKQIEEQNGGKVAPGGKLTGEAGFEIPKDARGLKFTYKSFMTDETVTFDLGK